ncbi:MAG TPA: type II toxin-antitoxin system RelE/ParE family toxin [Thermoanaerobaculia bacterium]|nr:type II toxin-antitoxin system RelE/ParE family toxin [Thermoanaerobaculia bacterium]
MSELRITFARSARKELERLDVTAVARIRHQIRALATEPRPPGCRKLAGAISVWRIRIGDYRVVYEIFDVEKRVDIIAVRHRKDAYR